MFLEQGVGDSAYISKWNAVCSLTVSVLQERRALLIQRGHIVVSLTIVSSWGGTSVLSNG